jgi:hypothetical protein
MTDAYDRALQRLGVARVTRCGYARVIRCEYARTQSLPTFDASAVSTAWIAELRERRAGAR